MPCMSELPATFPGRAEVEKAAIERTSLLLIAPHGLGATMLARRAAGILPGVSAVAHTYQAAGLELPEARPFRAPHYTVSSQAITGTRATEERRGGAVIRRPARPGELALAHGGVLFLDDLPEFAEMTIKAIANTCREGACRGFACRPALIIASAAPCPCGWKGTERDCVCEPGAIDRYAMRRNRFAHILGIKDSVVLKMITTPAYRGAPGGEDSATIRARVEAAWSKTFGEVWS